jgi:hypothetical protein
MRLRKIRTLLNSSSAALQLAMPLGDATEGVASAGDWARFALLYSEFRLRGVSMTFSTHVAAVSTVATAFLSPTLYVCFDESAVTSTEIAASAIVEYDNHRIVPSVLGSNIGLKKIGFRYPGSVKDSSYVSNWIPTNNPTVQPGTIFFSSSELFATQTVATEIALEFDVEFRIRS